MLFVIIAKVTGSIPKKWLTHFLTLFEPWLIALLVLLSLITYLNWWMNEWMNDSGSQLISINVLPHSTSVRLSKKRGKGWGEARLRRQRERRTLSVWWARCPCCSNQNNFAMRRFYFYYLGKSIQYGYLLISIGQTWRDPGRGHSSSYLILIINQSISELHVVR